MKELEQSKPYEPSKHLDSFLHTGVKLKIKSTFVGKRQYGQNKNEVPVKAGEGKVVQAKDLKKLLAIL